MPILITFYKSIKRSLNYIVLLLPSSFINNPPPKKKQSNGPELPPNQDVEVVNIEMNAMKSHLHRIASTYCTFLSLAILLHPHENEQKGNKTSKIDINYRLLISRCLIRPPSPIKKIEHLSSDL